jgi:hypothetical protein
MVPKKSTHILKFPIENPTKKTIPKLTILFEQMQRHIEGFSSINPTKPNKGNIAWAFQDKQNPASKKHK